MGTRLVPLILYLQIYTHNGQCSEQCIGYVMSNGLFMKIFTKECPIRKVNVSKFKVAGKLNDYSWPINKYAYQIQ